MTFMRRNLVMNRFLYLVLVGGASCVGGGSGPQIGVLGGEALLVNIATNAIGRLASTGSDGMRSYNQWDALGRTTATEQVVDQSPYVFGTTYGYPQTTLNLCANNLCG